MAREAEPPSTTEAPLPPATAKPPPIGPKKGTKLKFLGGSCIGITAWAQL
ncbi:hypothetical protein CsSME_00041601 [Camellia sinensis var. sinensis]